MNVHPIDLGVTASPAHARRGCGNRRLESRHRALGAECGSTEYGWTGGFRDDADPTISTVGQQGSVVAVTARQHRADGQDD